jgi:hypothetical protein
LDIGWYACWGKLSNFSQKLNQRKQWLKQWLVKMGSKQSNKWNKGWIFFQKVEIQENKGWNKAQKRRS